MRYVESGKTYDIDNQKLKSGLTSYYEDNLLKPKVFKIHSSKINSLIGSGAGKKGKKVIFRYTSTFKKAVEQQLYISDISGQFENIFI